LTYLYITIRDFGSLGCPWKMANLWCKSQDWKLSW